METRPFNKEFARQIKKEAKGKNVLSHEFRMRLFELARDYNETYINHGAECVVLKMPPIEVPRKPNADAEETRLVAFNYRDNITPERAKEIFYLQRFFSTLFPKNFPHFFYSAASGKRRLKGAEEPDNFNEFSGTIRQKIELHPSYEDETNEEQPAYPFSEVVRICKEELGILLNVDLTHTGNIIHGADGGEYYTDTIKTMQDQIWDIKRIERYMQSHPELYDELDMRLVSLSLERLRKYFPQRYHLESK